MAGHILMVMTSHDRLGETGERTGLWLEEFAAPYYAFLDAGCEVTLASVAGGQVPLDPKSEAEDQQTEATRRFAEDDTAQRRLATTRRLEEMAAEGFDALFYPGGHGPLWDLADNATSRELITAFLGAGRPVALVCHGPIALKGVEDASGRPVVAGREATGFSDAEERMMGLSETVPDSVEATLRSMGAEYTCAEELKPHVAEAGLLVTGQNPASSVPAAEALLRRLA